jgi:hypothetical protein
MAEKHEGFSVNDIDDIQRLRRERSGWGFTREDLAKYHVHMKVEVALVWSEDTPVELRQAFGEGACVLQYIADNAVNRQLEFDRLKPAESREIMHGVDEKGVFRIIRDSGWHE